MAEPQQQQQKPMVSPFPTPPPFYHHFNKENIARLRQIRKENQQAQQPPSGDATESSSTSKADLDILQLPPELRYLIPPPPPSNDSYRTFGNAIDPNAPDPTLSDAYIEQLYPAEPCTYTNPTPYLIALTRSLLTTFLALVGILAKNPTLYESKTKDLEVIMFNVHDLVNRYRPHQARETLILMMEERIGGLREEVGKVREGRERVGEVLRGLIEAEEAVGDGSRDDNDQVQLRRDEVVDGRWKERQRAMWQAMEAELAT